MPYLPVDLSNKQQLDSRILVCTYLPATCRIWYCVLDTSSKSLGKAETRSG